MPTSSSSCSDTDDDSDEDDDDGNNKSTSSCHLEILDSKDLGLNDKKAVVKPKKRPKVVVLD